jgi:serine/threonine protein kinase
MEYCGRGDLQRYVDAQNPQYLLQPQEAVQNAKENPLSWIDIWKIISDIAGALAYCHYGMLEEDDGSISLMLKWEPVLHRDIKAANSE